LFKQTHPSLQFTGKERDAESGNDYFGARYYASSMGRMMSPDPSGLIYADPTNPQSFNLYAYVQNNPLVNVDPTGLDCIHINNDTGAYEGFERGDCDNSTEEKANSGQYIDGTVNTITTTTGDTSGVVTGYSGTKDDGSGTLIAGTFIDPNAATNTNNAQVDPDDARLNSLVQGVAQDTRSLPWLCNASLNARAAIPKTGIAVGGAVDRKGLHGSLNAQLAPLPGGSSFNYTQTGSKGGVQVNVPIPDTPFRASAGISPGRFNLGVSTAVPGTKNAVSAGATLSFGYLGDATCRN
jgi:RHS repeat-associated protein